MMYILLPEIRKRKEQGFKRYAVLVSEKSRRNIRGEW